MAAADSPGRPRSGPGERTVARRWSTWSRSARRTRPRSCSTASRSASHDGRADRRGRPQRRRQVDAAAAARRLERAGLRPGHADRRAAGRATSTSATEPPRRRRCRDGGAAPATAPSTSGPATPRSARCWTGSACTGSGWTRRPAPAVRRRAAPGRAGRAAGRRGPTCWSSTSRPTTSTSRASPGSPRTCAARRGGAGRGHPRPLVPGRGLPPRPGRSATARCRRYEGGYSAYVLARAERARQAAADRGAPAEPAAQGAGLAAARPAGPHQQAAVPDRGRQGADRRRAAAAGRGPRCRPSPPAGSASSVYDVEDVTADGLGDRTAARRRHLAGRPGRPDRPSSA